MESESQDLFFPDLWGPEDSDSQSTGGAGNAPANNNDQADLYKEENVKDADEHQSPLFDLPPLPMPLPIHAQAEEQKEEYTDNGSTTNSVSYCNNNIEELLSLIPADIPRNEWFQVACALKNEGIPEEHFLEWSQTAPDKYHERDAERVWEDACATGKPAVTIATLRTLAAKYGKSAVIPAPPSMLAEPQTLHEMAFQTACFIDEMFQPGERYELVTQTKHLPDGRTIPLRCSTEMLQQITGDELDKASVAQLETIIDANRNGAYFCMNPLNSPLKGNAPGDSDVADCRYTLIEADELTKDVQWEKILTLNLPIKSVVWSGGKSLHVLVRIDAGQDRELFRSRVSRLHEYLKKQNFPADPSGKNPSRLSRIPGFYRGEQKQYLAANEFGPRDWNTFEALFLSKTEQTKQDRRSLTSAVNGQKGGRPGIDVTLYAEQFLEQYKGNDGIPTLVFLQGTWWLYAGNRWQELPSLDLQTEVTHFLQTSCARQEGRISHSIIRDTMANLQGLCGKSSLLFKMPCWLPDGKSARGVMTFSNGLLDIPKLIDDPETELLPHSSKFFGKEHVSYAYDPKATCPKWLEYIQTTFDDDDLRKAIQMMFGYILSGSTIYNIGFFLWGQGGDGKSTCAHVLKHLVGEAQTCVIEFNKLDDRFSSIALTENMLNLVEELTVGESKSLSGAEKSFKEITGGSEIKIEKKYGSVSKGIPTARCVFATNELPPFVDRSHGLWDRLVLLPFIHRFRGTDDEKQTLKSELAAELPGIFNWAIEGARMLKHYVRFPLPGASLKLMQEHRQSCDHEGEFMKECLEVNAETIVAKQDVYKAYRCWSCDHGYRHVS